MHKFNGPIKISMDMISLQSPAYKKKRTNNIKKQSSLINFHSNNNKQIENMKLSKIQQPQKPKDKKRQINKIPKFQINLFLHKKLNKYQNVTKCQKKLKPTQKIECELKESSIRELKQLKNQVVPAKTFRKRKNKIFDNNMCKSYHQKIYDSSKSKLSYYHCQNIKITNNNISKEIQIQSQQQTSIIQKPYILQLKNHFSDDFSQVLSFNNLNTNTQQNTNFEKQKRNKIFSSKSMNKLNTTLTSQNLNVNSDKKTIFVHPIKAVKKNNTVSQFQVHNYSFQNNKKSIPLSEIIKKIEQNKSKMTDLEIDFDDQNILESCCL